jgi:hypothetical protein
MKSFKEIYSEAEEREDDISLLLGNGFSIAADRSFDYRRLLDKAKFGSPDQTERIRAVFETLDTADFEIVVQRLEAAVEILVLYNTPSGASTAIQHDCRTVRQALAETLAAIHPTRIGDVGDDRLDKCHDFLIKFDQVFTLNYDLLLYWAKNRKDYTHFKDGFRRPENRLVYDPDGKQTISWLHGAVHLYEELVAGDWPITVKQDWRSSGIPLIDKLREDLEQGKTPLIVMEGTWEQKQRKINSSLYLSNCLGLLRSVRGTLITYGWSMGSNDLHIRTAIENSQVSHLSVGLYGGKTEGSNPGTVGQAHALIAAREPQIELEFWDVTSADVW